MYWSLSFVDSVEEMLAEAGEPEGRFVLQRHCDGDGPHLDLRLEQEGYLLGWRIDGQALGDACWATEKMPHPVRWLDQDGDSVRVDGGEYSWLSRGDEGSMLLLSGERETYCVHVMREEGLSPSVVRDVTEALRGCGATGADLVGLLQDGQLARQRTEARLLGLGRELDGARFDLAVWQRTLKGMRLEGLYEHLRAFEARFDALYPPVSVSTGDALSGVDEERSAEALEISRGA